MARTKGKTEHTGAKNGGGGMWGRRAVVKSDSNKRRRTASKKAVLHPDFWATPEELLARQRGRATPKLGR